MLKTIFLHEKKKIQIKDEFDRILFDFQINLEELKIKNKNNSNGNIIYLDTINRNNTSTVEFSGDDVFFKIYNECNRNHLEVNFYDISNVKDFFNDFIENINNPKQFYRNLKKIPIQEDLSSSDDELLYSTAKEYQSQNNFISGASHFSSHFKSRNSQMLDSPAKEYHSQNNFISGGSQRPYSSSHFKSSEISDSPAKEYQSQNNFISGASQNPYSSSNFKSSEISDSPAKEYQSQNNFISGASQMPYSSSNFKSSQILNSPEPSNFSLGSSQKLETFGSSSKTNSQRSNLSFSSGNIQIFNPPGALDQRNLQGTISTYSPSDYRVSKSTTSINPQKSSTSKSHFFGLSKNKNDNNFEYNSTKMKTFDGKLCDCDKTN